MTSRTLVQEPAFMRPVDPIRIRRVRVKAVRAKYYVDGKLVAIGEESVMDYTDASFLIARGVAELVCEERDRVIPVRDLAPPPPPDPGGRAGSTVKT